MLKLKDVLKAISGTTHIEIYSLFKFTRLAQFTKNDLETICEYIVKTHGYREVVTVSSPEKNTIRIVVVQEED